MRRNCRHQRPPTQPSAAVPFQRGILTSTILVFVYEHQDPVWLLALSVMLLGLALALLAGLVMAHSHSDDRTGTQQPFRRAEFAVLACSLLGLATVGNIASFLGTPHNSGLLGLTVVLFAAQFLASLVVGAWGARVLWRHRSHRNERTAR